jgi:hypothetical protein
VAVLQTSLWDQWLWQPMSGLRIKAYASHLPAMTPCQLAAAACHCRSCRAPLSQACGAAPTVPWSAVMLCPAVLCCAAGLLPGLAGGDLSLTPSPHRCVCSRALRAIVKTFANTHSNLQHHAHRGACWLGCMPDFELHSAQGALSTSALHLVPAAVVMSFSIPSWHTSRFCCCMT